MIVVDTGPLAAAAIRTDPDHERCAEFLKTASEPLVVPQLVVVEAAYLIGKLVGASAEAAFARELARSSFTFEPFAAMDLDRMAELMDTYVDLPLGTVDAAVIATA